MLKCLLLFIFLVLSSCSSIHQELDPAVFYQRDLSIRVNGNWTKRMSVIPFEKSYKFKIVSPGKMDLLVIETCHRSIDIEDVGRREGYRYTPIEGIEDQASCSIIKFSSFEKGKHGRHAEGVLIVNNPLFNLVAKIKCNGKEDWYTGTSICHAKEGLYQIIEFTEEVSLFETKCKLGDSGYKRKFRFKMPNRDCRFIFKASSGKRHILYTSGYEQILMRE